MEIIKANSDNRGDVYRYDVGEKQHVIVTFKKGVARGGHYHQTAQWHIVLAGKFHVKYKNMFSDMKEWEEDLSEGDSRLIDSEVAHLFIAEEESVLAESRVGDYEATDYEPYRKLARPQ